jgi:hypothetical protein
MMGGLWFARVGRWMLGESARPAGLAHTYTRSYIKRFLFLPFSSSFSSLFPTDFIRYAEESTVYSYAPPYSIYSHPN